MRMAHRSVFVSLAFALASTTARAQDEPKQYPECTTEPTDGDVAAAKGAFQAGQASFNEADYGRAITYWEDAYRRDCTAHALLLNLARAYELNGDRKEAVVSLETYLARKPDTPQRDQIQRRIDKLNAQIAEAQPDTPPPDGTTPPEGAGGGTGDGPAPPPPTTDMKRPKLPLYVAAGGGAVFVLGGILYLGAQSDVSDYEKQCSGRNGCPTDQISQEANDARGRVQLFGAVSVLGLAVGAGGLIWYFVSEPEPTTTGLLEEQKKTQLSPTVGPGFAGLSFSGSF